MTGKQNLVSPVIITHYSPKEAYGDLKPPSVGIVERTISSMRDKLGVSHSEMVGRPLLIYNRPRNEDETDAELYLRRLEELSDERDLRFVSIPNQGIRNGLLTALDRTDAKYILFVEHDWVFTQEIELKNLVVSMEEDDSINYIRFNKRENVEKAWDTVVVEDREKPIPLCKVSSYSNNPHIARRPVYDRWITQSKPSVRTVWRKLHRNGGLNRCTIQETYEAVKKKYVFKEPHVAQFDDVEFVLDCRYKSLIEKVGFEEAHAEMGIYLYGKRGDGPFVEHLGRET